jgi:hypothetical protein
VILLNQSCGQEPVCQDAIEPSANAGFYKDIYGPPDDTAFGTVIVKGIQQPDTITRDTLIGKKNVLLPLPQGIDSCKFLFSFAVYDSISINDTTKKWDISYFVDDTLQLNFSRQMYLVSVECGFSHFYELKFLSYTNNFIRSAEIVNDEISNLNEQNIRIYF